MKNNFLLCMSRMFFSLTLILVMPFQRPEFSFLSYADQESELNECATKKLSLVTVNGQQKSEAYQCVETKCVSLHPGQDPDTKVKRNRCQVEGSGKILDRISSDPSLQRNVSDYEFDFMIFTGYSVALLAINVILMVGYVVTYRWGATTVCGAISAGLIQVVSILQLL